MDVKTLKFLMKVLTNRRDCLVACVRNCCSWDRDNFEGRMEENKDFRDYIKKNLSRNEKREAKSCTQWVEATKQNTSKNGAYLVVTLRGYRTVAFIPHT